MTYYIATYHDDFDEDNIVKLFSNEEDAIKFISSFNLKGVLEIYTGIGVLKIYGKNEYQRGDSMYCSLRKVQLE